MGECKKCGHGCHCSDSGACCGGQCECKDCDCKNDPGVYWRDEELKQKKEENNE